MSTIDPAESRCDRRAARLGSPKVLIGVAIGSLLVFAGTLLHARQYFVESGIGVMLGLPMFIVGVYLHHILRRVYSGKMLGAVPVPGVLACALAGGTVGAWWGWAQAREHGIWAPVVVTGISVTVLALLLVRRRNRARVLREVGAVGLIVPAVVTDSPQMNPSSGGVIGPITVRFTDASGTERWVTKSGIWRRSDAPKNGDRATVLFDPATPSDKRRIWIGPAGASGPEDFGS